MDAVALERIFAGWRIGRPPGEGGDGQPHVDPDIPAGRSLFEAIEQSGLPDEQTYILDRRPNTFAILNVYPYTSGHVMVLPRRAVAGIHHLWRLVRDASAAVNAALRPQGMNIGINEGVAGGGSVPDHLHVHVVPRWSADTNFMTSVANARVVPQTLVDTWTVLRAAWPIKGARPT